MLLIASIVAGLQYVRHSVETVKLRHFGETKGAGLIDWFELGHSEFEIPRLRRTHYQLTQIRFIAETFSSGACLVWKGLPAINS